MYSTASPPFLDTLRDRRLDGYPYSGLTLGLRTTSASSTVVHSETRCCEPILPIPSRPLQLNNITLTLPADLHDLLGMAKAILAVDG